MTIKICTALVAMLAVAGCSGMVAPTNEGSGPSSTKTTNSKTTTGDTTGGETTGETTGGETTGGETTGGEEGGETTGGEDAPVEEKVGTIADETTDVADFKADNTHFSIGTMAGFNSLVIADYAPAVKKIKSYGDCIKKPETSTETGRLMSITFNFMKSFTSDADHKVDDSGYPKENNNTIEDPANSKLGITGSFYDSKNATAGVTVKTGTVNFTDGKLPAKEGDPYEVTVDLTLSDGKKYKAKASGTVYKLPDNSKVTQPTCAEDEYAPPVYEE